MGSQCIKRLCKKKKYVNFNINNPDLNSENTLITIKNQNINNSCVSSKKNLSDYSDNTSTLQINKMSSWING